MVVVSAFLVVARRWRVVVVMAVAVAAVAVGFVALVVVHSRAGEPRG